MDGLTERLSYWHTGLSTGILTLDEVSAALEELLMEQENPSIPIIEATWSAAKGQSVLIDTLAELLRCAQVDFRAPLSPPVFRALLRDAGRRWKSGLWDIAAAADCLCRLALCCEISSSPLAGELLRLSGQYLLAEAGCGSPNEAVEALDRVLRTAKEELL